MIPKIIHYCWFGGKPLPDSARKCIRSWKKYCPGYQIKEWNESNFDFSQYPYMREAYENKKYAFVTDVARLIVLKNEGGIYVDVDVEMLKPFDDLLDGDGFFGFESDPNRHFCIASGLGCACIPNHPVINRLLQDYEGARFLKTDGTPDMTPCTLRNTRALIKMGLRQDNTLQQIEGVRFLPCDYLCPYDRYTGILTKTENTHSIHHYAMSWAPPRKKLDFYYQRWISKVKKYKAGRLIIRIKKAIFRLFGK